MKKLLYILFLSMFLLTGCGNKGVLTTDPALPEKSQISKSTELEINNKKKPSLSDIPNILRIRKIKIGEEEYEEIVLNYVYLTDGTQTMQPTLVREGDMFLGWHAERIIAIVEQYEDKDIFYRYIRTEFRGEIEIRAKVVYSDGGLAGHEGVYVHVNEEYFHLFPSEVNRNRNHFAFVLSHSSEVENLISEEFAWENGVIED